MDDEFEHYLVLECLTLFSLERSIFLFKLQDNRVHIGPKIEVRVVVLGLNNAGKSTLLLKLKNNEIVPTTSTIGFNVETLEYKNLRLTVWDVGGVPKLRPLWKHYYSNTKGFLSFNFTMADLCR